ncbi:hypothetical protein HRI_002569500 [Hibiscus trionum]|uniref:XS domain-containing protein n=1 Tax=Hibiscus trionum TaxID=183268 RepID=A0A9W7I517_HIBTR|nr:hypothetical protein HRI_002569500 [Hibiscus trionum]
MSSKKLDSRYPHPRSHNQGRLPGSKRMEPEKQLQNQKRKHEDNDSELCFKKLSEFNESSRRQQLLTSSKFQWNHLLSDNLEKAAAAAASCKPEPTMLDGRKVSHYSMSPTGVDCTEENRFVGPRPLHMKEGKPGLSDFRYPDVGNEGMVGETVGFGGFGERLDFDSSSVIYEKAMKRIRRTEEVIESSHRKLDSGERLDFDKVNDLGEIRVSELDRQQYMGEKKMELLHGERHVHEEDCSRHALTQRRVDFSGGEQVLGLGMNDCLFHHEVNKESHRKQSEQENEVLGRPFNGGSLQFQHSAHFSRKCRDEMAQDSEDLDSRMVNGHQSPKRVPFHGEKQELSEDYGHTLPQTCVDFGREPRAMEQANDVFMVLSEGEKLELATDYDRSLPQGHIDFHVESNDKQLENGLLGSWMNHQPKQNETPLQDFSLPLPHHQFGLNGESQVMEQETEVLGSRMCYPQDQNEAYFHGEILQLQQDCALGIKPLPVDDDVRTNQGCNQHISSTKELSINSQSPMQRPKKRIIDLRKIRETRFTTLTQTSDVLDDDLLDINYGGERSGEDSGLQWNITDSDYQFSSPHIQEFAQPTNRKSIKQRLGRSGRVNHPSPPHGKSIKERLGPPCQAHIKPHSSPPCQSRNPIVMSGIGRQKKRKRVMENVNEVHSPIAMPRIERQKLIKPVKENINEFHKGVQARDVISHTVKRGRTEPPEDSDEFKQLIHGAYIKFVKVLNENPAQRRKYTDKGEVKTLKCCVCGSKSEDFDTLSLVMHAFTSQKSRRRRVEHLGLHKALCLLMGWDSMAISDGLWVPKALPYTEALAMKEDLVIWPPVVILHNSSIGTTISDDRIVVSHEELKAFLRDTGFGREISKVCRGKPANQSIMVVIFHGTFSGLREAERLHHLYAENKHGRAEFLRGETQKASLNKVKDVLYGYLGIAGDLDKLDFETKSHSVVKSKKEIYGIAAWDASK